MTAPDGQRRLPFVEGRREFEQGRASWVGADGRVRVLVLWPSCIDTGAVWWRPRRLTDADGSPIE